MILPTSLTQFARLSSVPSENSKNPLSEREREILRLIAQGFSNPEIGRHLHLAEGTIKNYVSAILQKTGTRDRTQAALRAQMTGWI